MKARQLSFRTPGFESRSRHGGDIRNGMRKLSRPYHPRYPLHVTLRSHRARGDWSLARTKNERQVKHWVRTLAKRFNVKIYKLANSGNHLHLLLQTKTHDDLKKYLRALTGILARVVTGARKGRPIDGKFWDALAFTRIVEWGRDFKNVIYYIVRNELEELGVLAYSDRFIVPLPHPRP